MIESPLRTAAGCAPEAAETPLLSREPAVLSAFRLHGEEPCWVAAPRSESGCVAAVCQARDEGGALVPWGGGTSVQQGNGLRKSRWAALSTENMSALQEYSPDDMVVTAGTGMTLQSLQTVLREKGQMLPLDAPQPERATLGGIVATNAQGLWQPAYGLPRERLLGVRVVLADGSVVKGGGKVVKNVAGYDLCKLFAGSWGTLGAITEVTFKTEPIPRERRHLNFRAGSLVQAVEAALSIHAERLQPLYISVLRTSESVLSVGLVGGTEAVRWQQLQIAGRLTDSGFPLIEDGPSEDELRSAVVEAEGALKARISLRPADLPPFLSALEQAVASTASTVLAHVPTGIVELSIGSEGAAPGIASRIRRLLPAGGTMVLTHVGQEWRSAAGDVWGAIRGDHALMKALKAALDPHDLFSPGRFVGGI